MNGIGWAVKELRDGRKVKREGWPPGNFLKAIIPDSISIFIDGKCWSYTCVESDLMATDWELYTEKGEWQPIETAPRDKRILFYCCKRDMCEAPNRGFSVKCGSLYDNGHFVSLDGYVHPMSTIDITHWMPLPEGPK